MRRLVLLIAFLASLTVQAEEYSIDPSKQVSKCEGWGVSLCWWAAQCGKYAEEQLDSLIDWLVSPEGLNYTVFRYNIAGGDDPDWQNCEEHHFGMPGGKGLRAEMEGFKKSNDDDYDWKRDEGQRRIMLMIHEKRSDAVFEAYSNSAPWWMTVSGCVAGSPSAVSDNLSPQMYDSFAQYLVDVCMHYKEEYDIEFASLDPFNEPMSEFWYQNGSQEGCHFDVSSQIAFVRTLYSALKASGLSTVISAPDENSVEQSIEDILAYRKAGVLSMVGQWNTHSYEGTKKSKERLAHLCDSLDIQLWQSETGNSGHGLMGNLRMAQRLVDDIRYLRPAVWCDWQYVEQNYDQWSLVKCDKDWDHYARHSNYYVRQQFSRFVPSGYHWLDIDDPNGLAAVSPDGKRLVYVTINATPKPRDISLQLPASATLQTVYRTSSTERCQPVEHSGGNTFSLPPISVITAVYNL